ncbi:MAG: efflux RND transporter periplasmic adaptor subunit [Chitinivibrionia bacterium]|jgi:RND family efflux transporter MFP subunit|nr:efflux RND transporter periplasmic adaptor subunit [Chitinivibrionia bacterium]
MKKLTKICALVALSLLILGCGRAAEQERAMTIQEIQAIEGIPVRVKGATLQTIRRIERTSGTAEGLRQSMVSNGPSGTLQRIMVRPGDRVREGEVIAQMFFEEGAPRTVAQANFDRAEATYNRVQRLFEEGAATQEQIEGARVQFEDARRSLRGANVAEFITAPFAGVVLETFSAVGTRISGGTNIANIADFSTVRFDARINQMNIGSYAVGQRAFTLVESDTVWGRATSVAVGADAQTHSFRVRFEFPNPRQLLRVGEFKEIFVITQERQNAIAVPIEIVVSKSGVQGVYVVENQTAVFRPIEMGILSGSDVEVVSGLQEGDVVVIAGMTLLSDGVKVNVRN